MTIQSVVASPLLYVKVCAVDFNIDLFEYGQEFWILCDHKADEVLSILPRSFRLRFLCLLLWNYILYQLNKN